MCILISVKEENIRLIKKLDAIVLVKKEEIIMIKIHIGEPEKLSNNILVKKSAFVSFDYNPDIVSFIKQMGTRVYNPDNHTWEMPINNIIGLCNKFENQEIQISGIYEDLHKQEFEIDIPKDFINKPYENINLIETIKPKSKKEDKVFRALEVVKQKNINRLFIKHKPLQYTL